MKGGHIVGWLRAREVLLNLVAAVLGIYLAAGNLFKAAKYPDAATWAPWTIPFALLLVSALFVPLFALWKFLDARLEKRAKERAVLDADMGVLCQQLAAVIARACPALSLDHLAVQVWLCRDDDTFDRRYRFFLPYDRNPSGIAWKKGVGITGTAWSRDQDLAVDLREVVRERDRLGADAFDALPANARYGLTSAQYGATARYTGIIAKRLFGPAPASRLVGLLVVDVTGDDVFECVVASCDGPEASQLIGSVARRLATTT